MLDLRPAPDPSPSLYGWSIASDRHGTYLFAQCHRQFGFGFLGHDPCTAQVRVARLPRGDLDAIPRYWDGGRGWPTRHAPSTSPRHRTRWRGPGRQPDADHVRPRALDRRHQGGRLVGLDDLPRPGLAPDRAVDDRRHDQPAEPLGDADEMNTYFASVVAVHWSASSSASATTGGTVARRRTTARRSSPCRSAMWNRRRRADTSAAEVDAQRGRRPRSSPRRRR